MTNEKLIIKDPTFAAYLLSKGREPQDIEPAVRGEQSKVYVYGAEVKDAHFDRSFIGSRMPQERASWRNFVTWMNRLIEIEDLKLRQRHDRVSESGLFIHKDEQCFATTNQAVAAFIFGIINEQEAVPIDVQTLGKDRGYRFIFTKGIQLYDMHGRMLESDDVSDTWCRMKDMYKLATMVRREQTRNSSWL